MKVKMIIMMVLLQGGCSNFQEAETKSSDKKTGLQNPGNFLFSNVKSIEPFSWKCTESVENRNIEGLDYLHVLNTDVTKLFQVTYSSEVGLAFSNVNKETHFAIAVSGSFDESYSIYQPTRNLTNKNAGETLDILIGRNDDTYRGIVYLSRKVISFKHRASTASSNWFFECE